MPCNEAAAMVASAASRSSRYALTRAVLAWAWLRRPCDAGRWDRPRYAAGTEYL